MASLPPALLDLTLLRMANAAPARLSNSFGHAIRRRRDLGWCRQYHAAVASEPSGPNYEGMIDGAVVSPYAFTTCFLHRSLTIVVETEGRDLTRARWLFEMEI
jgi:hypothetical protein